MFIIYVNIVTQIATSINNNYSHLAALCNVDAFIKHLSDKLKNR